MVSGSPSAETSTKLSIPAATLERAPREAADAPIMIPSAVIHEPWGAHPSDVFEHYYRDIWFTAEYAEASKTVEGFQKFMEEWVYGVTNRNEYIKKLGAKKEELRWRK